MFNGKHSAESIRKMSESHKNNPTKHWLGKKRLNMPKFKGGKYVSASGYIYIHCPEHPFTSKNNYLAEHRLVMEKHLSRYLTKDEIIHHINHIKSDNRIENLMILNRSNHIKIHRSETIARICSIEGCFNKHEGKGFCNMHYIAYKRNYIKHKHLFKDNNIA